MKKTIIIMTILSIMVSLISCGADDTSTQSESASAESISNQSVNESQEDDGNSQVDVAYEFDTEAEAVEHYFSQMQEESLGETQVQSNGQSGVYVYSLENIPEGFSLGKINGIGNCEYYNSTYREADVKTAEICANNAIYFRQYRNANGDDKLQDRINSWTSNGYSVNELSNKSGYYYVDCGSYYIYWCEDGYCFYMSIPSSVGSVNTTTHEYSGEDVFTLQKTFYPFDDNTVAE